MTDNMECKMPNLEGELTLRPPGPEWSETVTCSWRDRNGDLHKVDVPCVDNNSYDKLAAIVIKLHLRVEELERELT